MALPDPIQILSQNAPREPSMATTRAEAVKLLLRRTEATKALLNAIDKNDVPLSELSLEQRQALLAHPDAAIVDQAKALLARGGGLPSADRQKVIEDVKPMLATHGSAARRRDGGPSQPGCRIRPEMSVSLRLAPVRHGSQAPHRRRL